MDSNLQEVLDKAPNNDLIKNTFIKADKLLTYYKNPCISISGGSDSDVLIDLIEKIRFGRNVLYVFFDTGIEYQATKKHLDFLEKKYGVKIKRERAIKPVPIGCKKYGVPFLSKKISDYISRLQRHDFKWEDDDFEVLYKKYPNCKSALRWWCNDFGENSSYNIKKNKYLKDFMIQYPPDFNISDKCCNGAKKESIKDFIKKNNCYINIVGERKAEGGARATSHRSCFDGSKIGDAYKYLPMFFWSDKDKREYEEHYGLTHSDCYEKWGMKRTGCAGCPFGSRFEEELELIKNNEKNLFLAVNNIFGDSYEYMRKYRDFKKMMNEKEKQ